MILYKNGIIRYKKTVVCLIFCIILITSSWASGPSIDEKGKPLCEVISLKISKTQRKELGTKRVITLTKEQMALISPFWTEDTIGVVSENWHDCICGLSYGYWSTPNEFSICKNDIPKERHVFPKAPKVKSLEQTNLEDEYDLVEILRHFIIMDEEGSFHLEGTSLKILDIKLEYIGKGEPLLINVPSCAVISRKKVNNYLKPLKENGIEFFIFG